MYPSWIEIFAFFPQTNDFLWMTAISPAAETKGNGQFGNYAL